MSRFYLTGVNSRGNTISAAGASSGQDVHLRGWQAGIEVVARPKPLDLERDLFVVYATGGSGGAGRREEIGTLQQKEDGSLEAIFPVAPRRVTRYVPRNEHPLRDALRAQKAGA